VGWTKSILLLSRINRSSNARLSVFLFCVLSKRSFEGWTKSILLLSRINRSNNARLSVFLFCVLLRQFANARVSKRSFEGWTQSIPLLPKINRSNNARSSVFCFEYYFASSLTLVSQFGSTQEEKQFFQGKLNYYRRKVNRF
jgi:hypothetical protein